MKKFFGDTISLTILLILLGIDIFVWQQIFFLQPNTNPEIHFLDVGQGDSELLILPGGVTILTDAGPDSKVVRSLEHVLPAFSRSIDLAVITHPQLDHFNGFLDLIGKYHIGAFLINGRSDSANVQEWPVLLNKIDTYDIPLITVGAGDKVRYRGSVISFLSPNTSRIQSAELNDTGLVEYINAPPLKALFTADIDSTIEEDLASHFDIRADVLKISHHGSKYSSSLQFLQAVNPKIAAIEVGGRNHYGHPGLQTLEKLFAMNIKVFRTDRNGTISIYADDNKLRVVSER